MFEGKKQDIRRYNLTNFVFFYELQIHLALDMLPDEAGKIQNLFCLNGFLQSTYHLGPTLYRLAPAVPCYLVKLDLQVCADLCKQIPFVAIITRMKANNGIK